MAAARARHPDAEALAEKLEAATRAKLRPEIVATTKFWRESGAYDEWVEVSVMEEPEIHNYPFLARSPQLEVDREIDVELVADDLAERATQEWERRQSAGA